MDISNFQLDSVIGHRTENPCVGGSIPSLAINKIKKLRPPMRWLFSFVPPAAPLIEKVLPSACSVLSSRRETIAPPSAIQGGLYSCLKNSRSNNPPNNSQTNLRPKAQRLNRLNQSGKIRWPSRSSRRKAKQRRAARLP